MRAIIELLFIKTTGGGYRVSSVNGLECVFHGSGNTVEIYEPCVFERGVKFEFFGDGCAVSLNKCRLVDFYAELNESAKFTVDENSSVSGRFHLINEKNTSVSIGKECMFSGEIQFWPTDGHTVKEVASGRCINKAKNGIVIGNHVWIGYRSMILKNVRLPDHCIVGAGSVVSRSFDEENIVIAGNPAVKVKSGVDWGREPPC